ncbi:uncharacterized protein LOC110093273 [Dendrobium catenatum]|uniref:Uncharacterized protein n=1 Tax=Dendrobium catenatum TaxID=906689 RepID=A0A2I0WK19_9ASPA|nr:uncharacterized protein LOC110093273 [Dendrobium catenatum]PKU76007.1 hypothetical protein MA16_Dca006054 [Dendrobium catenatum]
MDESWDIPMGLIIPRRRSTEDSRRRPWAGGEGLDPNDFRDVFGGPPRTVLLRRFSGEFSLEGGRRPESIYDEMFRSSERGMSAAGGERRLPGFRIPPAAEGRVKTKVGFYDDIFGSDGWNRKLKSQSMEKSKPSELSPTTHCLGDDAIFSTFAAKLRPITIPTRRHNSPPSTFSTVETSDDQYGAINHPCLPSRSCFIASTSMLPQHTHANFSYSFSPPDTINLEPSISQNQKNRASDGFFESSDIGSPSSVISSVFLETMGAFGFKAYVQHPSCEREVEKMVMEVEERNIAESPFVIEIDSHGTTEVNEISAAAVDEAIAWAKEKFFSHVSTEAKSTENAQTAQKQMELEEKRGRDNQENNAKVN